MDYLMPAMCPPPPESEFNVDFLSFIALRKFFSKVIQTQDTPAQDLPPFEQQKTGKNIEVEFEFEDPADDDVHAADKSLSFQQTGKLESVHMI